MHKQPNIILVVLDTHRVDKMSLYGYDRKVTPVIDAFAARSTVFDRAIAAAQWTIPSHASMFTGMYPTEHQTYQSYNSLPEGIPTVAELLGAHGYTTVGFCNNGLVSVLDNGFRRGFDQFYNYSATIPDNPMIGREVRGLQRAKQVAIGAAQKVTNLVERQFGRSPLLLKLAMMPFFVPVWTRMGKFKGDTERSLRDVVDYLRYHRATNAEQPFFMFINMMEVHLPYFPPRRYVDRWVPYLKKERASREFVRRFNLEGYRWAAPVVEPFTDWQQQVILDLYDAEIAYQDRQLRRLFRYLRRSGELENTMVIVTADHGEGHGDHDQMGHAFVVYKELVHVPLIIHYPALFPAGERLMDAVSTRRIFHTILEAAGVSHEQFGQPVGDLSLARAVEGKEPEHEVVIAEAYPPQNFVTVVEMNNPEAIELFRCRMMRRAIYDGGRKLITVEGRMDEFFDVDHDPQETQNLLDRSVGYESTILEMERRLEEYVVVAEAHRDGTAAGKEVDFSDDPELLERLRRLGYIE
jgi:arylsulfatase A-like enzyme